MVFIVFHTICLMIVSVASAFMLFLTLSNVQCTFSSLFFPRKYIIIVKSVTDARRLFFYPVLYSTILFSFVQIYLKINPMHSNSNTEEENSIATNSPVKTSANEIEQNIYLNQFEIIQLPNGLFV